jgi:hypothetical protein
MRSCDGGRESAAFQNNDLKFDFWGDNEEDHSVASVWEDVNLVCLSSELSILKIERETEKVDWVRRT